jgi:Uma2 family endonuclease
MSTARDDIMRLHRLSVADYHHMAERGILRGEDRVELIEGAIIDMSPIGSQHARAVTYLTNLLVPILSNEALVRVQNPINLGAYSELQPDIAITRYRQDLYGTSHPSGAETLLVIEVADSSFKYDREIKIPLYGRHGIPEVWLVDLEAKALQIFLAPTEHGYTREILPDSLSRLAPTQLPDLQLDISDLFAGL